MMGAVAQPFAGVGPPHFGSVEAPSEPAGLWGFLPTRDLDAAEEWGLWEAGSQWDQPKCLGNTIPDLPAAGKPARDCAGAYAFPFSTHFLEGAVIQTEAVEEGFSLLRFTRPSPPPVHNECLG